MRLELLNAEQLEERGRELAGEHVAVRSKAKQDFLLPRLAQNDAVIRDTCRVLADAIKRGSKVTPAGEWLLDNLYLIDEQVRMARRHLPAKYSWQLPILREGISEGLPRVYDIALNAISHGDGRFDESSLSRFMVSNAGGGYSRWQDIAVTRWQEDATRDAAGVFCYLRDRDTGKVWSNTPQPTLAAVDFSEAVFTESSVEFRRRLDEIEVHTQIVVSPEDDIELRRIRITNRSRSLRTIEATSYAEVVLAPAIADALHPAFSNLFVQTEILPDRDAILAARRRASSEQAQAWMMHAMSLHDVERLDTSFETDRTAFIGRGNALDGPAALRVDRLSQGEGAVLDPIASIRHAITLKPDQTAVLDLVIGIASTREQCLALVDKYRDRHLADRAIDVAWTHNRIALGEINISEVEAQTYGRLAGALLYADPARRASSSTIAANRLAQPGLWPFAISGDHPIVLLQISGAQNLALVRQSVHAHGTERVRCAARKGGRSPWSQLHLGAIDPLQRLWLPDAYARGRCFVPHLLGRLPSDD